MSRAEPRLSGDSPARSSGTSTEERWNDGARRLLLSLARGDRELDGELEGFLRRLIRARARRFAKQLGQGALGTDPEDVAQRVFLQLLENPPSPDGVERPLRRLVAWINTVTRRYLLDLAEKRSESLTHRGGDSEWPSEGSAESSTGAGHLEAREDLRRLRAILATEYPAGLALFELLLDFPQATSAELARELGCSVANVHQMRSRLRRVLRNKLADGERWRGR